MTLYAETRHLSWKSIRRYGRSKLPSSYSSEVRFFALRGFLMSVEFTLELEYQPARAATAAMSLPLTATRSNYTVKYADTYTRVTKLRGSSVQLCLQQPHMPSLLYLCSPKAL